MTTEYIIKRDVDANFQPVTKWYAFWAGKNGGGWVSPCGATTYATRKQAEAAIKRNAKSGMYATSFRRCNPYIVEVEKELPE